MSPTTRDPATFLPTAAEAFRPVEQYLERLGAAGRAVPPGAALLRPIDALIVRLLTAYRPSRPAVLDRAAARTAGASTVLCATDPNVARTAVPAGHDPEWGTTLDRFLGECAGGPVSTLDEADAAAPGEPLMVLAAADDGAAPELAEAVGRWLGAADAPVVVLGVGRVGACPTLTALTAAADRLGLSLALVRELAPALAGCRVAVVYRPSDPATGTALFRIGRLYNDHCRFLDLVEGAYLSAVRRAPADDPAMAGRLPAGATPRPETVRGLQHALAAHEQQAHALRQLLAAREERIGLLEDEVPGLASSRLIGLAVRLQRVLRRFRAAARPFRRMLPWLGRVAVPRMGRKANIAS